MKIIILAEPRTGSNLLVEYLERAGYKFNMIYSQREIHKAKENTNVPKLFFVHTHYPFLKLYKKYQQIITYRKNSFDQLMSFSLARETNQFKQHQYTNYKKIHLDISKFDENCLYFLHHKEEKIKTKKRKKELILEYEQIKNNPNILHDCLDINYNHNNWIQKKNPNQSQDLITNYKDLKNYFDNKWHQKFLDTNEKLLERFS